MITQARLRELVAYDAETGLFTWRATRGGMMAGANAGSATHGRGYVQISLDGTNYVAHRIAWLYVHGTVPTQIDHINGCRTDNRLYNLRPATQSQQNANSKRRSDNKSGARGVCWCKRRNRWRAHITVDGKQKYLGYHDTIESARRAYAVAAQATFGEFVRANVIR